MNGVASKLRNPTRAWLPAALLALSLGGVAATVPGQAQAADVQVRILVDVADLIFRSGRPYYYDYGQGYYQPVVVEYDAWRRPVYYRYAPPPPPPPVVVYRQPVYYYAPPPPRHYAPPPRHHSPSSYYRASHGKRHDDGRRYDKGRHDDGRTRGNDRHRGR